MFVALVGKKGIDNVGECCFYDGINSMQFNDKLLDFVVKGYVTTLALGSLPRVGTINHDANWGVSWDSNILSQMWEM
jgi:hypothetical protein